MRAPGNRAGNHRVRNNGRGKDEKAPPLGVGQTAGDAPKFSLMEFGMGEYTKGPESIAPAETFR